MFCLPGMQFCLLLSNLCVAQKPKSHPESWAYGGGLGGEFQALSSCMESLQHWESPSPRTQYPCLSFHPLPSPDLAPMRVGLKFSTVVCLAWPRQSHL